MEHGKNHRELMSLMVYDMYTKYKLLKDEHQFIQSLTIFYSGNSKNSPTNSKPTPNSDKFDREFEILGEILKIIGDKLENSLKDIKYIGKLIYNGENITSDTNELVNLHYNLFFKKYFELYTSLRKCLNSFNFLQRKLTSLMNVYPTFFDERKLPSFKEKYMVSEYIKDLLYEYKDALGLKKINKENRDLVNLLPEEITFYWAFNNEILTEVTQDKNSKSKKILIISSDFFTQYQYTQWLLFYHELLHTVLGSCLQRENSQNEPCVLLRKYLALTITNIYSLIKTSGLKLGDLLDPTPLIIDIIIDFTLSKAFGLYYLIPMFLKLFLYDQNEDLSDIQDYYPHWYLRISSVFNLYGNLSSRRWNLNNALGFNHLNNLLLRFKEYHIKFEIGVKGTRYYQILDLITFTIVKSVSELLSEKQFKKHISPFSDFPKVANDHENNYYGKYRKFLSTFYDKFPTLEKHEGKEWLLSLYYLESTLLIKYLLNPSNNGEPPEENKKIKPLVVIMEKLKFDKNNIETIIKQNTLFSCSDFKTFRLIEPPLYTNSNNQSHSSFYSENLVVILGNDRNTDINELIKDSVIVFSRLSIENLSSFKKLNKLKNVLKNRVSNYIPLGSLDWYNYELLLFFNNKKEKIDYYSLANDLYKLYKNLFEEQADRKNSTTPETTRQTSGIDEPKTSYSETSILINYQMADKLIINSPTLTLRMPKSSAAYDKIESVAEKSLNGWKVNIILGQNDLKLSYIGERSCKDIIDLIKKLVNQYGQIYDIKLIP